MASFKHTGDKALRFCFDIYDLDGGGSINLQELKSVLSCVMRPQDMQAMSGGGGGGVDGDHDRKLTITIVENIYQYYVLVDTTERHQQG